MCFCVLRRKKVHLQCCNKGLNVNDTISVCLEGIMSWDLLRVGLFGVSEKQKQVYYCEDRWCREGRFAKRRRSHNNKSIYEVVFIVKLEFRSVKISLHYFFTGFTNKGILKPYIKKKSINYFHP